MPGSGSAAIASAVADRRVPIQSRGREGESPAPLRGRHEGVTPRPYLAAHFRG